MQPFSSVTGVAVPMFEDDINTDQIAPVQMARGLKPDYRALLFLRQRHLADGRDNPDFVFNKPQFREPAILVTGKNFGCGSSREAAVWTMLATGIRCIVARSFADIYRENCLQNGLLPVELPPTEADAFEARVDRQQWRRTVHGRSRNPAHQWARRPGYCVRYFLRRSHASARRTRRYRT